jgi:hypothetical protein
MEKNEIKSVFDPELWLNGYKAAIALSDYAERKKSLEPLNKHVWYGTMDVVKAGS